MVVWLILLGGAFTILILFRQRRVESEALEIPSAMVMLFHPTWQMFEFRINMRDGAIWQSG